MYSSVLLLWCFWCLCPPVTALLSFDASDQLLFKKYLDYHSLTISESDYNERLRIFSNNLNIIKEWNKKVDSTQSSGVRHGITKFSHMTKEEWLGYVSNSGLDWPPLPRHEGASVHVASSLQSIPMSVDWSQVAGAMTPIKDQAGCGSCTAFSVSAALETAWFISRGTLPFSGTSDATSGFFGLSEQQLISCNPLNNACLGGLIENGFVYAALNGGLLSENLFPYTSGDSGSIGACPSSSSSTSTSS